MDYKGALEYISRVENFGSRPGLSRIGELLRLLGNPEEKLKFVHIAGTNGKGSAAAMLASVMKTSGYRTGLYTSPYLYSFNERMQINGKKIGDEALADVVGRIQPAADKMEDHPTEFELITAAAMLWFAEEKCDIVILEAGLGGRLDATNIIEKPEAAVIMNIGLDHTAVLGDSAEKIAFEKAGIIKNDCDCVSYEQTEGVREVLEKVCAERGARLHTADFSQIKKEFDSLEGQVFSYRGRSYATGLLGEHQLKNAAVVLETAEVLRQRGWKLSEEDVEHGLYAASWPARFEIVHTEPYFVVDGGHNPQCAETVAANLRNYFPDQRRIILLGVLADKDYRGLAEIIDPEAAEYVCVAPDSKRALSAEKLGEFMKCFGKKVTVCDNIQDGVSAALDAAAEDGMVCAVGSLYMAGDIRACFNLF
ncbi:MAG: bifunctional folylpolyglutamate synthase/dihydrofolate synthase [Candidatus Limivicinus sp.]|jgi:dihydrofolate synthase/folylpolyglutamate synthase